MRILTIARNTFRELIRGRAMLAVLAYLILVPALAIPGGYVAVGQERKILVDVGLSLLTVIGILLGAIWGTGLTGGGLDRASLGFLLSKPVDRWQLILGRFGGLMAAQGVATGLMGVLLTLGHLALMVLPWGSGDGIGWNGTSGPTGPASWLPRLWLVIGLVYLELLIVTALAMLFRALTSQALATVLTFILTLIGRSAAELIRLAESVTSPLLRGGFRALYFLIPNLASLNHLADAGYDTEIPLRIVGGHLLYAIFTIAVILILTIIVFERREVR